MATDYGLSPALANVRRRLVVSCQAPVGNPMRSPSVIARIAASVVAAGASGVRIDSPDHITAVKESIDTTVIGLWKSGSDGVYITPTFAHARAVVEAGADIVAIDGTARARPDDRNLADVIRLLHAELGAVVLADVGTIDEGLAAADFGADAVATTLAGLTIESAHQDGPALEVVATLAARLDVPVIAEGRITSPGQACEAMDAGAWCVVIGKAITSPDWITSRYVEAIGRWDGTRPHGDLGAPGDLAASRADAPPERHPRPGPELVDGQEPGRVDST